MTTDVINGVPRSLLAALATEADKYDDSSLCVINDNCELWQIGHIMPTVTVGHLRAIRALLATAQPAAEVIETDCRSEEGVTVGLIDALIAICRPLATRDLATPATCAALEDLRSDSDALAIFLGLPPAADGEREAQESADDAFRAWERDGNPISGANGYMAAERKDGGSPMTRDSLLTLAQRLRECNHNLHHINPMSEAFHSLITEAAGALSELAALAELAALKGGAA